MVVFHAIQIGLTIAVWLIAVERARALAFRGAIDSEPFLRRLGELLSAAREPDAIRLGRLGGEAWIARLACAVLEAPPSDRAWVLADEASLLQAEALKRLRVVRGLGTVAAALGLTLGILALTRAFQSNPALPQGVRSAVLLGALGDAVLSMSIGMVTSVFAITAAKGLGRCARDRLREAASAADLLRSHIGSS